MENFYQHAMDEIAGGATLSQLLENDTRGISKSHLLRYIMNDPARTERYHNALAVQSEMIFARLQDIALGNDTIVIDGVAIQQEPARITAVLNTAKYVLSVNNPQRFRESKQVDVTTTHIDQASLRALSTDDLKRMVLSGQYSTREDSLDVVENTSSLEDEAA